MNSDLVEHVFLRSKRTNLEGDVICNDDNVTTTRILGRFQCHLPRHHSNLISKDHITKKSIFEVMKSNSNGRATILEVALFNGTITDVDI